MTTRLFFSFIVVFFFVRITVHAQDDGSYKTPPKDIADMLLAKPTPNVGIDDKGEWMLFSEFSLYPSVEELARPELKIAGLRINPANYAPSRQN
ncbi:MAG TPA: hypothetical protein VFI06_12905, partial [Chitinophagaceae bacterium]|nr:hypothetical protein [Chitinophagaceae bacterium]